MPAVPLTSRLINITGSIQINKDFTTVFAFLSDYRNDPAWRKEINSVNINTEQIDVNSIITEESFLSKKVPQYKSVLCCMELVKNTRITSETTAEALFWAKNMRMVEQLGEQSTKVTYQLQFDCDIVKHGLGFRLPAFLVKYYTKATMNKYLGVLKQILEKTEKIYATKEPNKLKASYI